MPRLAITWDCSVHALPVNAACAECARVVNALKDAFPRMRALKMRRAAAEMMLGFAASQYGLVVAGDFGRTPEIERDARGILIVAARQFVSAAPTGRRRR